MSHIRKSVRSLMATSEYRTKGIFDDFQPIDQIHKNQLVDPFFLQTVALKELLHEIEGEAFTKKAVRVELLGRLYQLQKPPGTQFNDVFYKARMEDDGKPPSKEELLETPYNVIFRYDMRIDSPFKALLKTLNEVGSGKSQNDTSFRSSNNGQTAATSTIVISPEGISNIIEDISSLMKVINSLTFEDTVRDFGFVKALEILEPKSLASSRFQARFRDSLDINSVISIDDEEEEDVNASS